MRPVGVLSELCRKAWPRSYSGACLKEIAFPLGGIGTGTVSLGGRGQLRDWEIFNRPDKGNDPPYCLSVIRTQTSDDRAQARVLEGRVQPPFGRGHGLPAGRLSGIPRLRSCSFTGAYPFAYVAMGDPAVPVEVTLEAFNPLVPGDPETSGIPAAVLRYHVHNPGRETVRVCLAFVLSNLVGPAEGKCNERRSAGRFRGLQLANASLPPADTAFGTMAVAAAGGRVGVLPSWPSRYPRERLNWQAFWHEFKRNGSLLDLQGEKPDHGTAAVSSRFALPAGRTRHVDFIITWHFPNRTPAGCEWDAPDAEADTVVGNHYATLFADAWAVVEHLSRTLRSAENASRAFVRSLLESTLPPAATEAALNNLATLRTNTCFRTADGAFYGFEGCGDGAGCCFGNCTHVWNYEQTTAFLFPSLARSMRETDFLAGTDERGHMAFRALLPAGRGHYGYAAADGQMGCLVRLYREWKMCGDTRWLRRLWPAARRALEFCWVSGGWDADRDGVMEGVQHTTYDTELVGPNPLCQVLYLCALKAVEKMALALGEGEFASRVLELFEKGRRWTDENLFNGSYYQQQVRAVATKEIAEGLWLAKESVDPADPTLQVGDGCLTDQLLGQALAHVAGLGYLLAPGNVRKAARAIYRHNRVSMTDHECLHRTYALNDERGLVVCSWPNSPAPAVGHWFFTEVWTGAEYQAATLMVYEGLVKEGVGVLEDVRERYDGLKRNPWDEPECGHHYARAMAAWGLVIALSGFQYSALTGEMQFMPRTGDDPFRCFWSVPGAWGTVRLDAKGGKVALEVLRGKVALKRLRLPARLADLRVARCRGQTIGFTIESDGPGATVSFRRPVSLRPGAALTLR